MACVSDLHHLSTTGLWALTLCLRTNLAICQSSRICTYTSTSFLPQGSKLSLFSLYEQRFLRYVPIFKIAIFGHDTWSLAKIPEVAHIASFYPRGNWAYFRSTGSGLRDTGGFSKLPYLGVKLGHSPKFQKLHIYFLNYPLSPKFHSVLLCGCPFSKILSVLHFPIGHIMHNGK